MPDHQVDPLVWALRHERLNQRISYAELAKQTGISVSTLKRLESGRVELKLKQYRALLAALKVSDIDMTLRAEGFRPGGEIDVSAALRMIPQPQRDILIRAVLDMAMSYAKK